MTSVHARYFHEHLARFLATIMQDHDKSVHVEFSKIFSSPPGKVLCNIHARPWQECAARYCHVHLASSLQYSCHIPWQECAARYCHVHLASSLQYSCQTMTRVSAARYCHVHLPRLFQCNNHDKRCP